MGAPLDLFSGFSPDGAWTVTQFTRRARAIVEAGLPQLWVRGEVTGFKRYQSGHWYFTLRDRVCQVRCVMWAKENRRLPAAPTEGLEIVAFGRPTVWEERGEFRLTVVEMLTTTAGGMWQVAFERAKANLMRDGLLDPARKRALPTYPERIALVTSRDGAALRDIVAVVNRRWPVARLVLFPAIVQGDGAEESVCRALALLARVARRLAVDVAIVGRGGGSKEDLWTFNSERIARAVAASPVPIVSAVGHETDVTLCDLVADARAATPSHAAAAVTPDRAELAGRLAHLAERLGVGLTTRATRVTERLDRTADRLGREIAVLVDRYTARIGAHGARLDALSPLKVLARGYAVARDAEGRVLKRVAQFPPGLGFRLRVADGDVAAEVPRDG